MGRRPDDAVAFVESVEHATNESLTEAIYEIFAPHARSVMITDGAREESVGLDAIHSAWVRTCTAFKARQFRIHKHLIAATDDTIVNEWYGGPRGRSDGCGIEVWRFDPHGKVIDQRLYSYLKVRSPLHPLQTLKLILSSPSMTMAVGRARLLKQRPAGMRQRA